MGVLRHPPFLLVQLMKIFLDTADTAIIRDRFHKGLVDGVTTNPTLIMKSGRDPVKVYDELEDIGIGDISMEVVGNAKEMMDQALKLVERFSHVATIKVPCTEDGLYVCRVLAKMDVDVNVTLVFSAAQAILASKAGARYVSPFVGRVDDNSFDGIQLIKEIREIYSAHGAPTEILAASVRTVRQVTDSFLAGADLVTIPPAVLDKMYKHILTDAGLAQFEKDWKQVKIKAIKDQRENFLD